MAKRSRSSKKPVKVEVYVINAAYVKTINSIRHAALETGIDMAGIYRCTKKPLSRFRRGKDGLIYTFKRV